MIDIVAVLRTEDAALDFLSVLSGREDEVHVLCGDTGERLVLPAGPPPPHPGALTTRTPGP
ncbi:hypothetical protein ACIQRW_37050 [Streptomyces sp. NPDC091287]|uniref:hypothetical protein n=1 Tax=Streptomyces sp. NPDC091287 TaxID=3365988 RepID=UPI0037FE85CF